jgi:hypothetical protein
MVACNTWCSSCSYEKVVEVGEEKSCDTVGAMVKMLKSGKVRYSYWSGAH